MKEIYTDHIASILGVKKWQVENCAELLEDGCTVPFISRYRKERTGSLDDVSVAEIRHWCDVFAEMEKRKASILSTIEEAGKLTPELKEKIENCVVSSELEDLYLPFRPKRKTRATVAIAKGLEPLADLLWDGKLSHPRVEAAKYVKGEVESVDEALSGARDIIAERLSETASIRENQRVIFRSRRVVSKQTKAGKSSPEAAKYRAYFSFSMPLSKIPAHNLLGLLRAENEGFVSASIDADPERCAKKIYYDYATEHGYPPQESAQEIRLAVDDSFKRLIEPSITGEVLREAKEKADIESIRIFLQKVPDQYNLKEIKEKILKIDNVCEIINIHLWSLDGIALILTCKLKVKTTNKDDLIQIRNDISKISKEYDVIEETVEFIFN